MLFSMEHTTPKTAPFPWGNWTPSITWLLGPAESVPNGISISSAAVAGHFGVTNTQTNRHTDHATFDICRNRPHLRYASCMRCGLIILHLLYISRVQTMNIYREGRYEGVMGDKFNGEKRSNWWTGYRGSVALRHGDVENNKEHG